jgi:hypothetical protein
MEAREPQSELSNGSSLRATSQRGLAEGQLSVLGTFAAGTNDFELVLATSMMPDGAVLDGFEAVMPAHGHRSQPNSIEVGSTGYEILALPFTMSGVWRLTGRLQVAATVDEISFDVEVP